MATHVIKIGSRSIHITAEISDEVSPSEEDLWHKVVDRQFRTLVCCFAALLGLLYRQIKRFSEKEVYSEYLSETRSLITVLEEHLAEKHGQLLSIDPSTLETSRLTEKLSFEDVSAYLDFFEDLDISDL